MNQEKVLIGITGGIAAYKTLELIRLLTKAGAQVRTILTQNGAQFVTPLSVETLSGHAAAMDMFSSRQAPAIAHIELALWPDLFLVAPATANFLGKAANGIADDLLSTTYLALRTDVPVMLAPAMNSRMWNHPATKRNLETLHSDLGLRLHVAGPRDGDLACGEEGIGAMSEPRQLFDSIAKRLTT
jgi:phosphopantothenoylcysteine decarboxylase / phosphopantothenate---cysteine ligase